MLSMLLLFDILRGGLDSSDLPATIPFCTQKTRTRHTHLFNVPFYHKNYGKNTVITRLLRTYTDTFEGIDIFH